MSTHSGRTGPVAPSPDPLFADRRLAELYDPLDADRVDLDIHAAIVDELGARTVLDVGCGTGTFACMLAARSIDVVAVDPAEAMLDVARRKRNADKVRWVHGDATVLPALRMDVATMTGNVAQIFLTDEEWHAAVRGIRAALRPDGHLVFETRVPEAAAWREWRREATCRRTEVPGRGPVTSWVEVTGVHGELVSFRWTYEFERTGVVLTSDSTLRFRSRAEVEASLARTGFVLTDVRDAPDRPGREYVFLARQTTRSRDCA